MPHVFLSHATADDAVIDRLHDALEAATSVNIWVDHRDILPGDEWQTAIERALREAPYLLVALSRQSFNRIEVISEWRAALTYGHALLPVLLDDLPYEDIPYRLRQIQHVALRTAAEWDAGIKRLTAAVLRTRGAESADGADAPTFARWNITGTIARDLLKIPLRARDADLAAVLKHAADAPTSIIGVGGLGKSRLAAEAALTHPTANGAIWHRCESYTRASEVYVLLREHFGLPKESEDAEALAALRTHPRVVVIDNGESVPANDPRRKEYAALVERLAAEGAAVLLTSRVEWSEIKPPKHKHEPAALDLPAALAVLDEMARAYDLTLTDDQRTALATAARRHPRLMLWALEQIYGGRRPEQVTGWLRDLKRERIEEALNEMVQTTLDQMIAVEPDGAFAADVLRKLCVFAGGFTLEAAQAVVLSLTPPPPLPQGDGEQSAESLEAASETVPRPSGEGFRVRATLDEDALEDALFVLGRWRFAPLDQASGRYSVPEIVSAALPPDAAAHQQHYDYYEALAQAHRDRQDYAGLDVESANLTAAFEWAFGAGDMAAAYWLYNACDFFLANRGRFDQRMDWLERVAARLGVIDAAGTLQAGGGVNDPALVATIQHSLGILYQEHPLGSRRDNLRRAIAAYEQALEHYTPQTAPLDYAMTQNNLGNAYRDLAAVEDRAGNLRRALAAYEQALEHYTPQTAPLDYAMTQNNLGNAYRALAQIEDRAGNLRRALAAYEQALLYKTPQTAPLAYATTQNNLGLAYWKLSQIEDRAGNLQRAIEAFEQALLYWTPQTAPLYYATTQNNLGNAYSNLAAVEDRAGNLRRALAAYEQALIYRTPQTAPLDYAMTQNNLGTAYSDLAEVEDRAGNLRRAITAYEQALIYWTPQTAPLDYAMTQNNLGIAYRNLAAVEDRAGNLRRAIAAYEQALIYRTPQTAPLAYAMTQRNLGIAHEDAGDLRAAVACWRAAEKYYRLMDAVADADLMLRHIRRLEARLAGAGDKQRKWWQFWRR